MLKIESCSAGFSACGGSRSDKFCSAAVRSTRSAFLLYRKCNVISYKKTKRVPGDRARHPLSCFFLFFPESPFVSMSHTPCLCRMGKKLPAAFPTTSDVSPPHIRHPDDRTDTLPDGHSPDALLHPHPYRLHRSSLLRPHRRHSRHMYHNCSFLFLTLLQNRIYYQHHARQAETVVEPTLHPHMQKQSHIQSAKEPRQMKDETGLDAILSSGSHPDLVLRDLQILIFVYHKIFGL